MNISHTKLGKGVNQLEDEMIADLLQFAVLRLNLIFKNLRDEIFFLVLVSFITDGSASSFQDGGYNIVINVFFRRLSSLI